MKIEKSTDHKLTLLKESVMDTLKKETRSTLSATDVLAPTTMKNAAKCDTSCETQNPWVIKTLNATCTTRKLVVCLLECLFIPTTKLYFLYEFCWRRPHQQWCENRCNCNIITPFIWFYNQWRNYIHLQPTIVLIFARRVRRRDVIYNCIINASIS